MISIKQKKGFVFGKFELIIRKINDIDAIGKVVKYPISPNLMVSLILSNFIIDLAKHNNRK